MASIFSSASRAITSILDTVGDVGNMAQETVGIATNHVHNRATKHRLTDRDTIIKETAQVMRDIKADLDADDDLKALFEELDKNWDK